MSTLKLTGSSSGSTSLQAPASGSDRTITFPNNAGTVLTNATPGCILQVVQSTNNTATGYFDLASATDYYDYMNVAITPSSSSNKILISCHAFGEGDDMDHQWRWRIKRAISGGTTTTIRGTTADSRTTALGLVPVAYYDAVDNHTTPMHFGCSNYLDSPSTTSAVTYTFQMNCQAASKKWYYNRTVTDSDATQYERGLSYITVMEVAG